MTQKQFLIVNLINNNNSVISLTKSTEKRLISEPTSLLGFAPVPYL